MHTAEFLAETQPAAPPPRARRLETLVVDDRAIAFLDVGSGPPVILAHCSGGSHKLWSPLIAALRDQHRVLAPDLLGYGKSERWPVNAPLNSWTDLNVLLALAERAGGPVHLVGHSYGGAIALEAARVLGARVKSLTLIEPVAIHLLKLTGRTREYREITGVGNRMIEALRLRQDRRAAGIFMKYWDGRMRWWLMPSKMRARLVETVGKVAAEFESATRLSRTVGDYQSVIAPTRLVVADRTRQPARAIVEELAQLLPVAHVQAVAGAGHMSPVTHPAEVTRLVSAHIESHDDVSRPKTHEDGWTRAELSNAVRQAMGGTRRTSGARLTTQP